MTTTLEQVKCKPFLKWAGGKGQLINAIEEHLPIQLKNGEIDTYVEPFVGGGAIFFYIAQNYPTIKHFYLYDINQDLVNCYNAIKKNVENLIEELEELQREFKKRKGNEEKRKRYFYDIRTEFNNEKNDNYEAATAAKLIFLNRTCFNGLYRVNRKGEFNVPFGRYKNPKICNSVNLRNVSNLLQKAEIICGDFKKSIEHIDEKTFVYFDPPYRPLSATASFTSYSKDSFTEKDQENLAEFCKDVNQTRAQLLLSNSDPKNEDKNDHFFEVHYKEEDGFKIHRVKAIRAINCKAEGRGQIDELIIINY